MPPGRPDRSIAAIFYVVWPVAGLVLLVLELARGNVVFAAKLGMTLLIGLPVLVYCYRRDFRPDGE